MQKFGRSFQLQTDVVVFCVCEFMQPSFWLSYVPRVSGDKDFDTRVRRHFMCHLPLFMRIHYML